MKKLSYLTLIVLFAYACGNNSSQSDSSTDNAIDVPEETVADAAQIEYDEQVGHGKFTEENFEFAMTPERTEKGTAIYSAKCQSCHKLTDEQLVGPGFKGVSERRTPVWIMNFLTNTDEMIDLDPALQEQLEVCMLRMPDQSLSDEDAHAIVSFFHANDASE